MSVLMYMCVSESNKPITICFLLSNQKSSETQKRITFKKSQIVTIFTDNHSNSIPINV